MERMSMQGQNQSAQTGTKNETYNVISILYHALQGTENCQIYLNDAPDGQAREFFEQALHLIGDPPPEDVAYVGDRLDNDVLPAALAGMRAVWLKRGPWAVITTQAPQRPCRRLLQ